jgi:hypothetical protein
VTPPEIDPGTSRLVAQCLNHYATPGPNKKQKPTDINVLQFRILTNNFKIFNIQKDEIHIVLNIATAL